MMKINLCHSFTLAVVFAVVLCAASRVQAQITGIISGSSVVTNAFVDNASLNNLSQAGAVYVAGNAAWNGGGFGLTSQTDPTTHDSANSSLSASYSGNAYSLTVNNLTLAQTATDTGHADLIYIFNIDYQLGSGGLPSQATLFPNFLVNGTILTAGSFASITGFFDYYGDDISGPNTLLDTVNYNWTFNNGGVAGNFINQLVTGTPVNGTTPVLNNNSDLRIFGQLDFKVDPASISVESVPEPSGGLLIGLAGVCGILWRRVRQ
jgi:hypothetical protein